MRYTVKPHNVCAASLSFDLDGAHTLCGFTVYLMIQLLLIIRFRDKECALAHSYAEA